MKILLKFGDYCESLEVLLSEIGFSHSVTIVLNNNKSSWIDESILRRNNIGLSYIGGISRHYSRFIPSILIDFCSRIIGHDFLSLVEEYHINDYRNNEKLLRLRTLYVYFYWSSFLIRRKTQLVLIKGGTRLNDRMLLELVIRKNIDFFIVERGPFFETYSISQSLGPNTYAPANSIISKNRDTSWITNMLLRDDLNTPWAQSFKKNTLNLDDSLEKSDQGRFIFFPLQVFDDSNTKLYSGKYFDSVSMLNEIIAHWSPDKNTVILVKEHPKAVHGSLKFARPTSSKLSVIMIEGHVEDIIRRSSLIITLNSNIGFEALLLGIPVLHGGDAWYSTLDGCKRYSLKALNNHDFKGLTKDVLLSNRQKLQDYFIKFLFSVNEKDWLCLD